MLNAAVNGSNTKSRIQNVETINLKGEYLDVGFDLINVSGTKTLNLSTKIAGGTGTVTNANSMNAAKIVAGENIGTLAITSLASGTRDTVTVDAGNATKVNLTGVAAGADSYDVKLAENATVVLATTTYASPGDKLRLDLAGGKNNVLETDAGGGADNKALALTLNASTADAVVDLTNGTKLAAKTIEVTGSKNVTLTSATGASLVGDGTVGAGNESIKNTGTGTATIKITGTLAANQDFQAAQVDVFEIAKTGSAATGSLTLNENTKLNLAGDAGSALTLNIDDGNPITATFTAGTARVDISETQSAKLVTGANVKTVLVNVTPDEVTDTDKDENGHKESSLTLAELDINTSATTTAAVIQGSENLVITTLTIGADKVLAASNLTGNLTLGTITGSAASDKITIVGGKGNTTIGTVSSADVLDIQLSAGTNNITLGSAAANSKVTATGGTNTIASNDNAVTIKLAGGNDTVTVGKNNTVTLGGGNDTVILALAAADSSAVIKDFEKGTDTLRLTGVATADVDLSKISAVSKGVYDINGSDWQIELQNGGSGLTATDMRDSIQLQITAADGSTVIAGDKNDTITVDATESATITTGAGSDKVVLVGGKQTKAIVKDFTVGSDKIVVTGEITKDIDVNLKNVAPSAGEYTIGDGGSAGTEKGVIFTLQNNGANINTDGDLTDIVQLGQVNAAGALEYFKVGTEAALTKNVTIIGGKSNDYIELKGDAAATKAATYKFTNDGSVDKIKLNDLAGKDMLDFTGVLNAEVSEKVVLGVAATSEVKAKIGDAKDKAVYIFDDSAAGIGGAKITTMKADTGNGITQADVNAEVAAFINAGLGVSNGEQYVVIINDNSTNAYDTSAVWGGGGITRGITEGTDNAYIYLVSATGDTVTADNLSLIGVIDNGADLIVASVVSTFVL